MAAYYYFVAQLPQLSWGVPSLLLREEFLAEAEKWLGEKEFAALCSVSLDAYQLASGDSLLLAEYKRFEKALRQDIAFGR